VTETSQTEQPEVVEEPISNPTAVEAELARIAKDAAEKQRLADQAEKKRLAQEQLAMLK